MAIFIRSDGTKSTVTPADGKAFTLSELQAFVGGYIELVRTNAPGGARLVIHEEGKLIGLPPNQVATSMYEELVGGPFDVIVGDVLLATLVELGEEHLA